MLRCYPGCAPIHVLPWGIWDPGLPGDAEPLRREFNVPADARVLLTLSRISPEKGQDLLLDALLEWERSSDFPRAAVAVHLRGRSVHAGQRFLKSCVDCGAVEADSRGVSRIRHRRTQESVFRAGRPLRFSIAA